MAPQDRRPLSAAVEDSSPAFSTGFPAGPAIPASRPWGGGDWLFIFTVFVAVFLAYQPAWRAGFIWDDGGHVTPPALRSWHGLGRIWFELGATQQYYPLLHSVFWIEHRFFGDAAPGYHLFNISVHALNAVLAGLILRRLRVPGAYLAAGIFALHPVMVESVAWVTELKNTLSGLFYLSAGMAYLRFDEERGKRWYALALGLFVLGLLSKTTAATLPGALLVVLWWRHGRLSWRREVVPLAPFFVLGAACGLFTAWVEWKFIGAKGAAFAFTFIERGLIAGRVIWFYLGKLVWPAELVFIYPRWSVSQAEGWQYLYPSGVLLGLAGLWRLRHRSRGPLAGALFFIGTLFPVLGFFNVYPFVFSFVADHFQYLASLGVITLVSAGLTRLSDRWRFWQPGTPNSKPQTRNSKPAALGLVLLVVLGVLTWRQSRMYRDAETLYETTLARNPGCWLAHNNLGIALFQTGRVTEAIRHFEETLRLKPGYAEAHNNMGIALVQAGRVAEAIGHYEEALRLQPDSADAHNDLALALVQTGRIMEAIGHYGRALQFNPGFAEAHYNWGNALLSLGRVAEAVGHYREALRLKPDYAEAHNNLGSALFQMGRVAEAIGHYEEALRLKPDYADARDNLARLRALQKTPGPGK